MGLVMGDSPEVAFEALEVPKPPPGASSNQNDAMQKHDEKQGKGATLRPLGGPAASSPQTLKRNVPATGNGNRTPAQAKSSWARRPPVRAAAGIVSTRSHAFSRNWSGAIVPATGGERFTRIEGSWSVPRFGGRSHHDETSLVSIWIGLGGSRMASHSMPQMGSEHGWLEGKAVHRLWCQWWLGNATKGYLSHFIDGFDVPVEQKVKCSLDVAPDGKTVSFFWTVGASTWGASATCDRPVMADTANWIVERPSEVFEAIPPRKYRIGERHPLPVLTTQDGGVLGDGEEATTMEDCSALLGAKGQRYPGDGRLVSLRSIDRGSGRLFTELEPVLRLTPGVRVDTTMTIRRFLP